MEVKTMTVTRLKTKNQITIPQSLVKRLHLKKGELFAIDIEDNYLRLMPVEIAPKYSAKDLKKIDRIVKKEKGKAKSLKSGKEFGEYITKI
jgi:bifunctional DNA-binding transcriptional regulator/antitoxin component of YhaV-PrlF toxin-antitoxin module